MDEIEIQGGTGATSEATRVVSLARSLLAKGGALESTTAGATIDRIDIVDALARRAATTMTPGPLPPSEAARAVAGEALANAERALSKTAGGASPTSLTDVELASLEAIIEVTGRPAMRFDGGRVRMPESALGENERWRVLIALWRSKINAASAKVGRIMAKGAAGVVQPIATGWRVGDDLVVTNRHVAAFLVADPTSPVSAWTIDAAKRPTVDFAATDGATDAARFDIGDVVYCADSGDVDVAIVRVASGVEALPPALRLDWASETLGRTIGAAGVEPSFQGREVYVVGHPYRLHSSEAIAAVFGTADGLKRWSPGLVVRLDSHDPAFEHDCSTLGGNSGSCVLAAEKHEVVGIHFGGAEVNKLTGLGRANLALALSRLGAHPAATILRDGRV